MEGFVGVGSGSFVLNAIAGALVRLLWVLGLRKILALPRRSFGCGGYASAQDPVTFPFRRNLF
jgi:hypothetical protein